MHESSKCIPNFKCDFLEILFLLPFIIIFDNIELEEIFSYYKNGEFMIREAEKGDLAQILELYLHLHEKEIPQYNEHLKSTWQQIIDDKNHHLIVCEINERIVSSCVCVIIQNLTRNVRPYAFIENVVTRADCRGKGYATACLDFAKNIAEKDNCYKMMLLTGSKEESTLNFYKHAGYNCTDKTAFIQWLENK